MSPARRWTVDGEMVLAAWLDFCLAGSCSFEESIIEHLESEVKLRFTYNAILEHLRQMLRGVSLLSDQPQDTFYLPASNVEDLIHKGSISLPNISSFHRATIAKLVEDYLVPGMCPKDCQPSGKRKNSTWWADPDSGYLTSNVECEWINHINNFTQLTKFQGTNQYGNVSRDSRSSGKEK